MELTQVVSAEPLLLQNVQRRRTSWLQCLGICSFGLLLGATVVLALLHFNVIGPKKQDELPAMPEVLRIKNYLESVPETQGMKGKKAAAHLMGKREDNQITWQRSSANAFQDGSIKFRENSLEIEEDGLYFVYTHVVFTGVDCPKDPEFSHSVIKKGEPEEVILKSSKTVCEGKPKSFWTQPIYQAGLFKLEKGDVLYTETSNVKYLDTFSGQVYFGILAV